MEKITVSEILGEMYRMKNSDIIKSAVEFCLSLKPTKHEKIIIDTIILFNFNNDFHQIYINLPQELSCIERAKIIAMYGQCSLKYDNKKYIENMINTGDTEHIEVFKRYL